MDVDEISPVAQDYLKAIWSATEWGADPITTSALAARFGTSAANVTDTVKRLAAQGLVEHTPYKPVRLTAAGTAYAVAMVRRHRLLETFLVTALGYGWDEVHTEAERLEHAVSDTLVERIDAFLDHPASDPHGDPIPDPAGRIAMPGDATLLDEVIAAGRYRVVRVSDADPDTLAEAAARGIVPGASITVDPAALAPVTGLGAAVWVVRARDEPTPQPTVT